MKLNLTVVALLALALLGGCSKSVEFKQLRQRDGIAYVGNAPNPYSGKVEDRYANGQKSLETDFVDGKQNGGEIKWYENGQKKSEFDIVDGKIKEIWQHWDNLGMMKQCGMFKSQRIPQGSMERSGIH